MRVIASRLCGIRSGSPSLATRCAWHSDNTWTKRCETCNLIASRYNVNDKTSEAR